MNAAVVESFAKASRYGSLPIPRRELVNCSGRVPQVAKTLRFLQPAQFLLEGETQITPASRFAWFESENCKVLMGGVAPTQVGISSKFFGIYSS